MKNFRAVVVDVSSLELGRSFLLIQDLEEQRVVGYMIWLFYGNLFKRVT